MVRRLTPFSLKDCIDQGLIRKIPKSTARAESSLDASRKWINEAKASLKVDAYNSTLMASYLAMFHASRSLLYKDGYRERSHYCIARYIEAEYVQKGKLEQKWVDLLDHYREQRHKNQYTFSLSTTQGDAEDAVKASEQFFTMIETLF